MIQDKIECIECQYYNPKECFCNAIGECVKRGEGMITWVQRRGQIKHLLYELCLTGRIDRATFLEQLADLNKVEPVVRCKDCKHWAMHSWCSRLAPFDKVYMGADDFCSKGKRRDEVEE